MPTALEAEINSLLKEHVDTALVADELMRRWERNVLSDDEQAACAQFLIDCGYLPSLFRQLERLADEGGRFPWAQVGEAIGRSGLSLNPRDVSDLIAGAKAQRALSDLALTRAFDSETRELHDLRESLRQQRALDYADKRQVLLDRLAFMRANRMMDEEAKVIAEARALFPGDPEFEREQEGYDVRWAREVVANSATVTDPTRDLAAKIARLPPEQISAKSFIVMRAKELAKDDPGHIYDLAVSLHFMDFNAEAVELLAEADGHPAADWLRLELMVQARQYVSVLDETTRLEVRYASEPDTAFAVVYARARALWGLGQSTMAIDLLRSLVRIRPGYKSAHSLLLDWTGGDT